MQRFRMIRFIIFQILVFALLASCGSNQNADLPNLPTSISPAQGMGGMKGVISNITDFWQGGTVYVFAAEYHGDENGKGIYVLEPSIHPYTTVDIGGIFQINDMPVGEYVLVIGPSPEEAIVVRHNGDAKIYEVTADNVTDAGSITLEW